MKKGTIVILVFGLMFLVGCIKQENNKTISNDTLKMETKKDVNLNIITTDKLLYNMIKNIVRDRHSVEYMFKNREAEMNFQFSEDSLNNIAKKDLFLYVGAEFEPWANEFIDRLNKNKVGVINVSRGVKLFTYNKVIKYKSTILKDNPYYLMNIDNYKIALMNIKNAVQDRDPKNRDIYEKNFSDTLKNVSSYEKDLKAIRDKTVDYTFIAPEDELIYFIKYNDMKILDVNKDENNVNLLKLNSDLDAKLKNTKNLVFLYNDESTLKINEDIIKKYNIKTLNIKIYNGDTKYEDILKYDIENFKKFFENEDSKK